MSITTIPAAPAAATADSAVDITRVPAHLFTAAGRWKRPGLMSLPGRALVTSRLMSTNRWIPAPDVDPAAPDGLALRERATTVGGGPVWLVFRRSISSLLTRPAPLPRLAWTW
jgi:hypothetical protein